MEYENSTIVYVFEHVDNNMDVTEVSLGDEVLEMPGVCKSSNWCALMCICSQSCVTWPWHHIFYPSNFFLNMSYFFQDFVFVFTNSTYKVYTFILRVQVSWQDMSTDLDIVVRHVTWPWPCIHQPGRDRQYWHLFVFPHLILQTLFSQHFLRTQILLYRWNISYITSIFIYACFDIFFCNEFLAWLHMIWYEDTINISKGVFIWCK